MRPTLDFLNSASRCSDAVKSASSARSSRGSLNTIAASAARSMIPSATASGQHRSATDRSDPGGSLQKFPAPALFFPALVAFRMLLTIVVFFGTHAISLFLIWR